MFFYKYNKKNIITHRFFMLIAVQVFTVFLWAQPSPKEEMAANPNRSASNSVVYPTPQKALTPAPKGMKPFYLSHYGRHGSRYLTKSIDYEYVPQHLGEAEKAGVLTPLGKEVLENAKRLQLLSNNRLGELTAVGVQQQKDITRRMVGNFPELFRGNATIDARSTTVVRCILTMNHALHELTAFNPKLQIRFDASVNDLHYMNYQDKVLRELTRNDSLDRAYKDFTQRHWQFKRFLESLISDTAYIRQNINAEDMHYYLFRLAGSVQDTELADSIDLYKIFTPEEIYDNWLTANAWWFLGFGFTSLNGATQPFTQRFLLRQLIADADSCLQLEKPGVQLRYGHDTMVLPLVCLMGINGYDVEVSDLERLVDSGWVDYRVFPMSANIQLVFYRRNKKDRDPLLKVLLNEEEATLPIPAVQGPYYRWSDVRSYMLRKLDTYKEE